MAQMAQVSAIPKREGQFPQPMAGRWHLTCIGSSRTIEPICNGKSKGRIRMEEQKFDALCTDCGETFSSFLTEMAEHNAKVTACPKCGKHHDFKAPKAPVQTISATALGTKRPRRKKMIATA